MKKRNSFIEVLLGLLSSAFIVLVFLVITVTAGHPFFLILAVLALALVGNGFYKQHRKLFVLGLCCGTIPFLLVAVPLFT